MRDDTATIPHAASGSGPRARPRAALTAEGSRSDAFGPVEWGLLAAIAAIWGSSFLLIEIGLRSFAPGVVALARLGLGALALAAVPRARGPLAREDWGRVAVLGVLWMGVPLVLFPVAQQWVDSAVAGMMNAAMPLCTALMAAVLLRRLPAGRQLLGLAVGFAGVAAIMLPNLRGAAASTLGVALLGVAVLLYGAAANLAVPLQQRYGGLRVLLWAQVAALSIVAPVGLASLPASSFSWPSALAMLPLGVLGTGAAFVALTNLVGRAGAARGSVAVYFTPVIAIMLGVAFLGERVSPSALAGTALVIAGAWLASRRDRSAAARVTARGPSPQLLTPEEAASSASGGSSYAPDR